MPAVEGSSSTGSTFSDPARSAEAVVVGTELTKISRALYVGVAGDVTVNMAEHGAAITFKAVPAGSLLPIRISKVTAATATDMVSIY